VRDFLYKDADGRVRWHYVLMNVLCDYVSGEPYPASDADNARFIPLKELGEYEVTATAQEALERASRMRSP